MPHVERRIFLGTQSQRKSLLVPLAIGQFLFRFDAPVCFRDYLQYYSVVHVQWHSTYTEMKVMGHHKKYFLFEKVFGQTFSDPAV